MFGVAEPGKRKRCDPHPDGQEYGALVQYEALSLGEGQTGVAELNLLTVNPGGPRGAHQHSTAGCGVCAAQKTAVES